MHLFIRDLMNSPRLSKKERDEKVKAGLFHGDCCIGTDGEMYVYSKPENDFVKFNDKNEEIINIENELLEEKD